METLVANLSAKAKKVTWNGKSYLVAPVTMLRPGVLPGSAGPLYYPEEQVAKEPKRWNGIPIVNGHPKDASGKHLSARDPDVLTKYGIGTVYRSKVKGKNLAAEGWFDEERTKALAPKVYEALVKGEKIESSTGLDLNAKEAPEGSVHNGVAYKFDTSDYRPDHLAVLTDETGACSVKDGCGVFNSAGDLAESNQDEKVTLWQKLGALLGMSSDKKDWPDLVLNELSFDDIRYALHKALASKYTQADPHCYISEVYQDYFVYQMGPESYRQDYATTETGVSLSGEPVQVVRTTEYKPVTNTVSNPETKSEETTMKLTDAQRTETVSFIVANCDCWKGEDSVKVLNGMPDTQLVRVKEGVTKTQELVTNARKVQPIESIVLEDGNEYVYNAETRKYALKKTVPVAPPVTPESRLTPEEQRLLARAKKREDEEKQQVITRLVANQTGDAKARLQKRLEAMTPEDLEDFALLAPQEEEETPAPQRRYVPPTGRPVTNSKKEDDTPKKVLRPTLRVDWSAGRNGR